jgi:hypothetical protein
VAKRIDAIRHSRRCSGHRSTPLRAADASNRTTVLLGASPRLSDDALLAAIEDIAVACIVICKAPRTEHVKRVFARLRALNARTSRLTCGRSCRSPSWRRESDVSPSLLLGP